MEGVCNNKQRSVVASRDVGILRGCLVTCWAEPGWLDIGKIRLVAWFNHPATLYACEEAPATRLRGNVRIGCPQRAWLARCSKLTAWDCVQRRKGSRVQAIQTTNRFLQLCGCGNQSNSCCTGCTWPAAACIPGTS